MECYIVSAVFLTLTQPTLQWHKHRELSNDVKAYKS